MENWKAVKGYVGHYEVSSLARVRSLNRSTKDKLGSKVKRRVRRYKGRILKYGISKSLKYPIVILSKRGKTKTFLVHRLFAEAYLPPRPKGCEINHINGDRSDLRKENLEWVTHKENMKHSILTGLRKVFVIHGQRIKNKYSR